MTADEARGIALTTQSLWAARVLEKVRDEAKKGNYCYQDSDGDLDRQDEAVLCRLGYRVSRLNPGFRISW